MQGLRVRRTEEGLRLHGAESLFVAGQRVRQAQISQAQTLESAPSKLLLLLREGGEQARREEPASSAARWVLIVGTLSTVASARSPSSHGTDGIPSNLFACHLSHVLLSTLKSAFRSDASEQIEQTRNRSSPTRLMTCS